MKETTDCNEIKPNFGEAFSGLEQSGIAADLSQKLFSSVNDLQVNTPKEDSKADDYIGNQLVVPADKSQLASEVVPQNLNKDYEMSKEIRKGQQSSYQQSNLGGSFVSKNHMA